MPGFPYGRIPQGGLENRVRADAYPFGVGVAWNPATMRRNFFLRFFSAAALALAIGMTVSAQDAEQELESPGDGVEDSRDALITKSLELDIATSGREELEAWCLVLGLDDSGTDESLRARLRAYYGLMPQGPDAAAEKVGSTRVVIESAKRSEYLKMSLGTEDEDESVVRLTGDVVLTVEESDRGRTHTVRADSVIFNQAGKTISALGNIEYVVDTGGREETFTGDSLVFTVTDWTGVIFKGTSERSQEVDGEEIDFYFRGDSIKRSGTEILVLENGVITSHDVENPDFSLQARKIWITGPGEWGLFSATLYVGHVPVFYLPFYWKAGSDLLFNPVIGQRTGAGYYIQTTTYFLGRKEEDDDFSILGFGDSAAPEYALERDGLYMVRSGATGEEAEAGNNTLKLMLDAYTSLGFMTGLYGDFPKVGENGQLDFYASLGFSRSVDGNGGVYFRESAGDPSHVYWNSGRIGKFEVPFRWGLEFNYAWENWDLHLDWYSDPSYLRQFDQRAENFDWLSFLLSEEESDVNEPDLVTSMTWEIEGSHSFPVSSASPWLSSLSLDDFRAALIWKSDEIAKTSDFWNSPDAEYDPAQDYFYPDKIILPDIGFSLSGSSPQWVVERVGNNEGENERETEGRERGENVRTADIPFQESFDSVFQSNVLEASIKYGLDTQLYIEDEFNSEAWDEPADIDFETEAAKINTTQTGHLWYGMDFWDGLTGISGTTSLSGYFQTHANLFGGNPAVEETRTEDMQYTKFLWDNSFSLSVYPFQGIPSLSSSTLKYGIDANLYAREFASGATAADPLYVNSWISGPDDFRKHDVSATLKWAPGYFSVTASTAANIPPLDEKYTLNAKTDFEKGGWEASIGQKMTYADDDWNILPMAMSASWTGIDDEIQIAQNARFDSENGRFSRTQSNVRFWGFEAEFSAGYEETYSWNLAGSTWDENGKAFVPSSLIFSYNREFEPEPMWKNRIKTKTVLDLTWDINLIQPTDNVLSFTWTQELEIFKFLDLSVSFSAANKSMYLYFPWWTDMLGIERRSFFGDLAKSFNFFHTEDRRYSQFNMDQVDVALVHHLRNWDLTVEYSGWPALESGATNYSWKSELSVFLKWNPLPMFNQRTSFEDGEWNVDSFE